MKSYRLWRYFLFAVILMAVSLFSGCSWQEESRLIIYSDTYQYFSGISEYQTPSLEIIDSQETNTTDNSENDTQRESTILPDTSPPDTSPPDTSPPDTVLGDTEANSRDDGGGYEIVYWVKNGKVWHIYESCTTLARSRNILSGSIEIAIANGKTRICEVCANESK